MNKSAENGTPMTRIRRIKTDQSNKSQRKSVLSASSAFCFFQLLESLNSFLVNQLLERVEKRESESDSVESGECRIMRETQLKKS